MRRASPEGFEQFEPSAWAELVEASPSQRKPPQKKAGELPRRPSEMDENGAQALQVVLPLPGAVSEISVPLPLTE
jgi:hypothetical protein